MEPVPENNNGSISGATSGSFWEGTRGGSAGDPLGILRGSACASGDAPCFRKRGAHVSKATGCAHEPFAGSVCAKQARCNHSGYIHARTWAFNKSDLAHSEAHSWHIRAHSGTFETGSSLQHDGGMLSPLSKCKVSWKGSRRRWHIRRNSLGLL